MADALSPGPRDELAGAREAAGLGNLDRALQLYDLHLQKAPTAEVHAELASVHRALGHPWLAILNYREAIRLDAACAAAHRGFGEILLETGSAEAGLQSLRRAVELEPEDHGAIHTLIAALRAQGERVEALRWIERFLLAAVRQPESSSARAELATALLRAGEVDEALREMVHAVSLEPNSADLRCSLGEMMVEAGQYSQALDSFSTGLRLDPRNESCRRRRACELLRAGAWREGWRERAALETAALHDAVSPDPPIWDGSDPAGKTILLRGGTDLGESIQFVRYASLLAEAGARVLLECDPRLVRLFARLSYLDAIVPRGHRLPPFDLQAPLAALPSLFGTTLGTVPTRASYLELAREVENGGDGPAEGGTRPRLRIGVSTAGVRSPGDSGETILEQVAPRLEALGLEVVLLDRVMTRGPSDAAADAPPMDLLEIARAMVRLDLLLTGDGVLAHLGGALGIPVWAVVPLPPSWRWLIGRDDSPWYPTLRLFRQEPDQDLDAVYSRIVSEAEGYRPPARLPDPPAFTPAAGEDEASTIFQTGVKAHLAGDLERAERAYRRTIALFPGFAEAHNNLGVLLRERDPREALARFRDAARLAPADADGLLNLSWALIEQGELEEAADVLGRACEADPSNLEARRHLATLLRELGREVPETLESGPIPAESAKFPGAEDQAGPSSGLESDAVSELATGGGETVAEITGEPDRALGAVGNEVGEGDAVAVQPEREPVDPPVPQAARARRAPRPRGSVNTHSIRRGEFRRQVVEPVLAGECSAREAAEAVHRFARGGATEEDLARFGELPTDIARRYPTLTTRSVQIWAKKAAVALREAKERNAPPPDLAEVLRHR